jgi:sodium pump decarboxylase gamma subunit
MTLAEKMSEGLVVLGVGVLVVFGVLILLWGLLELMRVIFYEAPKKRKASQATEKIAQTLSSASQDVVAAPASAAAVGQDEDDEEIIAVIAAAVAAAMDTSVHNLRIKSVRRVSNWKK